MNTYGAQNSYGMNRQVDLNSKKYEVSGKITSNNKQPKDKYSQLEIEEAKNATKGLGNISKGITSDNTGNYRKSFIPNLDGNRTNNVISKNTNFSHKEENFVVDKSKGGLSNTKPNLGVTSKLNFTQKYNSGLGMTNNTINNNQNTGKTGSYTSSKISKPFTSNSTNSNNITSNNNKLTNQKFTNSKSNMNNNKIDYEEVEDNRLAINTKR